MEVRFVETCFLIHLIVLLPAPSLAVMPVSTSIFGSLGRYILQLRPPDMRAIRCGIAEGADTGAYHALHYRVRTLDTLVRGNNLKQRVWMWHVEWRGPRRGRVVPSDGCDGRGLDSSLQTGYAIRGRVCRFRCRLVDLRKPRIAVG